MGQNKMIKLTNILKEIIEGTCGYDTDVKTGKKLDTPGGLEEGRPKKKDPKKGMKTMFGKKYPNCVKK